MSMIILKGKNLEKSYTNGVLKTKVLKGVNIEIKEGEFVSIMGKSGSGKSTLLNILSSLDMPDNGEIYFEGREITHLGEEEAAKLRRESFGFVFQLPKMVRNLSILDNILLPSINYKKNKNDLMDKAKQLMKKIGIEHIEDNRISQVSGGQLQRAGICRALINNPKILFADEPTGALDSKTGQEVLELFSIFHAEGKSILMVTHDVQVASKADRVLFMKDGLLVGEIKLGDNCKEGVIQIQEMLNAI
ncbi:MAG: ABC transporter ATP-binding protein [Gemella morbillorum]|nr:ABC transporter ATP-binding protein [Gemella morbillorum]